MKLVVDIPDDVYEHVKSTKTIETVDYDIVSLYRATKNGTPVPTDGDLISREALKEELKLSKYSNPSRLNRWLNSEINRCIEIIDNAPASDVETHSDRYDEGFRDGYSQCITDNEERKDSNRLFQKGGAL